MSEKSDSNPIEEVFREVVMMQAQPREEEDPYQSEEYQRFVESMVQHCHCDSRHCPCDGVLAGGICDGITDEPDDDRSESQFFDDED